MLRKTSNTEIIVEHALKYRLINSGSTMQICERVVSEPSDFCTSEPKVSNSVWTKAGGTGRHPSRLSFDALIRSCCDGFQENDSGWQESFELPLEFAPYFFDLDVGTVYEWDGLIAVHDFIDFCQPMTRFWQVLWRCWRLISTEYFRVSVSIFAFCWRLERLKVNFGSFRTYDPGMIDERFFSRSVLRSILLLRYWCYVSVSVFGQLLNARWCCEACLNV